MSSLAIYPPAPYGDTSLAERCRAEVVNRTGLPKRCGNRVGTGGGGLCRHHR